MVTGAGFSGRPWRRFSVRAGAGGAKLWPWLTSAALLAEVVGVAHVATGAAIREDYGRDEALGITPHLPAAVAYPGSTADVARLVAVAIEHGIPLTARGSGTGLSGRLHTGARRAPSSPSNA